MVAEVVAWVPPTTTAMRGGGRVRYFFNDLYFFANWLATSAFICCGRGRCGRRLEFGRVENGAWAAASGRWACLVPHSSHIRFCSWPTILANLILKSVLVHIFNEESELVSHGWGKTGRSVRLDDFGRAGQKTKQRLNRIDPGPARIRTTMDGLVPLGIIMY